MATDVDQQRALVSVNVSSDECSAVTGSHFSFSLFSVVLSTNNNEAVKINQTINQNGCVTYFYRIETFFVVIVVVVSFRRRFILFAVFIRLLYLLSPVRHVCDASEHKIFIIYVVRRKMNGKSTYRAAYKIGNHGGESDIRDSKDE